MIKPPIDNAAGPWLKDLLDRMERAQATWAAEAARAAALPRPVRRLPAASGPRRQAGPADAAALARQDQAALRTAKARALALQALIATARDVARLV